MLLLRLPCTFTELPENRTLVFAQQPGQLTYKPLPFWFSLTISYHFFFFLFPLFVIRFVPYAGKNGGHKIFWEFFEQLEKGTIRKKRGENSVMTFSFFCSFK